MHSLSAARWRGLVLAGALLAGLALTSTARAEEPPAAALPPSPACSGTASSDALIAGCGAHLDTTPFTFTWGEAAIPIEIALSGPRLAFRGPVPADARAIDFVVVWRQDPSTGAWASWSARGDSPFATLAFFEPGDTYTIIATAALDLSLAPLPAPAPPAPVSVFAGTRVVSLYGHPGVATMGALGTYASASAAADAADALAKEYAALAPQTRTIAALHLIVSVAQADPGWDGSYLGRMSIAEIQPYVEATRARGQLLFLDVQIGWSDPLVEVQRLEPLLREPHVHVALDPEFATKGKGWAPGEAIGYVTADQANAVQRWLLDLGTRAGVPPKVLVLHQFRTDMLHDPERIEAVDGVDVVIDMDGWGPPWQKLQGYDAYARASYAEYAGFKLFYHWDAPLLTPAEVMALAHPPDYVIYQ